MEELGPDILAAVGIVFGVTSLMLSGSEPPPVSENIRVLSRLDDYTRKASPVVRNTIPAFLTLPGRIRALEGEPAPDLVGPIDESASTLTVKDICEAELRKGICSPNVLLLVRQQYPGSYDEWPDGDLEKMILTQRPEHRDKLCILPAWIDATPHQIVKYEGDGQRALTNRPPRAAVDAAHHGSFRDWGLKRLLQVARRPVQALARNSESLASRHALNSTAVAEADLLHSARPESGHRHRGIGIQPGLHG